MEEELELQIEDNIRIAALHQANIYHRVRETTPDKVIATALLFEGYLRGDVDE